MANSTISRVLMSADASDIKARQQRQLARSNTQMSVNEICARVPFHAHLHRLVADDRVDDGAEQTTTRQSLLADNSDLVARHAPILTLPLVVAQAADGVPDHQRAWIKSKLLLASRATGNGVLEVATVVGRVFPTRLSYFCREALVKEVRRLFVFADKQTQIEVDSSTRQNLGYQQTVIAGEGFVMPQHLGLLRGKGPS